MYHVCMYAHMHMYVMWINVDTCIDTDICVCMHIIYICSTCIDTYTSMHTCKCVCIYMHRQIHMYACMSIIYVCMYVHTYIHACLHIYIKTYVHKYMHPYMHTCKYRLVYVSPYTYLNICIHIGYLHISESYEAYTGASGIL